MGEKMNIFEQLERIDEIIEKKFELEAQNMMQILEGGSLGGLGFANSGMQPLSRYHKDPLGNVIDQDNDDIPDNMDYHWGHGQYDQNDLNHNGTPDYLEE